MLPINKKNGPCDPISSNCVIWQGPDLPCVDICAGDSISAVIAQLCDQLVILQDCCGSGSGSIDITTINQTTLNGGPAYTVNELIQLIINNINNSGGGSGSGAGIWDCTETLNCTMNPPPCYDQVTPGLSNPDTIYNIIESLMMHHCQIMMSDEAMTSSIQSVTSKLIQLEKIPKGDPNPVLKSVCVDKDNTNSQPIANLVNKIEVDYCETKGLVGTASEVLQALAGQPTNPLPLSNPINDRSGFIPSIPQNPTSIGESLNAAWRLIKDLRTAVEKLQADSGQNGILLRMVGITTFYASGSTCPEAVVNATTPGNCVDLWNSTGNQFDVSVKAYSEPIGDPAYELTYGIWYALCPGTTYRAQYLGGIGGTTVAPFWTVAEEACS